MPATKTNDLNFRRRKVEQVDAGDFASPDHIHAVWTLPPADADFSWRRRPIKIGSSTSDPRR
jgi:REP element-mobilizing transposase RayT